jgi:hypothetical protein
MPDDRSNAASLASVERQRLASRRMQLSNAFSWNGIDMLVSVGFDRAGRVREIFAEGLRCGSDSDVLIDDACIMASLLLQHGYSATELLGKLMRSHAADALQAFADAQTGIAKPSLAAALIAEAVLVEADCGAAMRDAYRCCAPAPAKGRADSEAPK